MISDSSKLVAKKYYSGFELAHDTYNAMTTGSDGKIYYILCSEDPEIAAQMYTFDPDTDSCQHLGDLNEICGEDGLKHICQGKSHVEFIEHNGLLYFATHVGYYEMIDGMERLPQNPPEGLSLYPGGHFVSYNMVDGSFQDLARLPNGEGILTLGMDRDREQLYAISWPTGCFFHYDMREGVLHDWGQVSHQGEAGKVGRDYRTLCRSIFVDPRSGFAYFTNAEGDIMYYDPNTKVISTDSRVDMRLDYFGTYDIADAGSMGYNWRKVFWHPVEEVAYGMHGNSGYLFRFDPMAGRIHLVERLTSLPSRSSGMFDQFSYGYLGFTLGPDLETIYYLTGGPIYENGQRVKGLDKIAKGGAKGLENLHLVTYHLPSATYRDCGAIFYEDGSRPTYVNSIAIAANARVYCLARMPYQDRIIQDLIEVKLNLDE